MLGGKMGGAKQRGPAIALTLFFALSAVSFLSVVVYASGSSSSSQTGTLVAALSATLNPQSSTVQFGQTQPITLTITGGKAPYTVAATDSNSNWGSIGSATNVQSQYTLQYGGTILGSDTIKFVVSDSGTGTAAQSITQTATVDVVPATATTPPSTSATPITATVSPQVQTIQLGQSDPLALYVSGGTPPYSVTATTQDGTIIGSGNVVQSYFNLPYTPTAVGYYAITFTITDKANNKLSVASSLEVDPAITPTTPTTQPSQQASSLTATVSPTTGYGTVGTATQITVTPSGGAGGPYTIYVYDNGVYQTRSTTNAAYTYPYTPAQAGSHSLDFVVYDSNNNPYTQISSITVQQQTSQPTQTTSTPATQTPNYEVQVCPSSNQPGQVCRTCNIYNSTLIKYDANGNPKGGLMGTCTTCNYPHQQSFSCDIFQPQKQQPYATKTTTTGGGGGVTYTTQTSYYPDEYIIQNVSYLPYTGGNGQQISGGVSNSICVAYGLIEATTTWPAVGRNPGGSSPSLSGGYGYCGSLNNNQFSTTYSSSVAGAGSVSLQQSQAQPSPTPQIVSVLNQNAQNAQWLITCPSQPNPTSTTEYFSSAPQSFIGGNRCLTDTASLQSNVLLSVSTNWGLGTYASSQSSVQSQNFAQGSIGNIAYSGQTGNQGSAQSQISNGYSTQSYIFQQVPASQQHGLWTWQAKYANLTNVNPGVLQQKESVNASYAQFYSACAGYGQCIPVSWYCIWKYTYTESTGITSIQNSQIPIPTKLGSATTDYFSVNGNDYSLNPTTQLNGVCIDAMFWGWQGTSLFLTCGPGWAQISTQGMISYGGKLYESLNVYTNTQQYPGAYFAAYGLGLAASGGAGQTQNTYGSVGVLPYILYNVSLPATYSNLNGNEQFLNLSFDTYSPHNYLNPSAYLDQFPIYTDSGFLANKAPNGQTGVLTSYPSGLVSIASPNPSAITQGVNNIVSSLLPAQANAIGFGGVFLDANLRTGFSRLGRYIQGNIYNPIYVTAAPNDYVYAINYSTSCSLFFCLYQNTQAYLFVMRYIPTGYYNVSNDQPNTVGPTSSVQTTVTTPASSYAPSQTSTSQSGAPDAAAAWNANWQSYWANTTQEQSKNLYIVNIYQLSNPVVPGVPFVNYFWSGSSGSGLFDTVPIAIGSDYGNDVYVLGRARTGGGFDIAGIVQNPQDGSTSTISSVVTEPQGFLPSSPGEFAVSPGGQYVFVANSVVGNVVVYNTYRTQQCTAPGQQCGQRTAPYFTYSDSIPLSYSNSSYNMNISAYLNAGGPFANAIEQGAYKGISTSNDVESNHHPISLSDSQGFVYVLDNWTFSVSGRQSSILMLRAFSENGIEVPINPAKTDTVAPVNSGALSTGQSITPTPPVGWPAYGFPISAYITLPDGSVQTYCAVACSTTPSSSWLQGYGYYPIGPMIGQNGAVAQGQNTAQDIGISTDFNGTSYLVAHVSQATTKYAELLAFHPTLVNYTKISLGADAQYTCYTDMQSAQTPCTVLTDSAQVSALDNMYPPVLGVPSSFNYVESQGSPVQYLSGPNTLSSLFPTGVGNKNYQAQASSIASSGFPNSQPSYSQQNLQTGSYINAPGSGVIGAPSAIPVVYANSVIRGYAVVPYKIAYTVTQDWEPNPDNGYATYGTPVGNPPCGALGLPDTTTNTITSYTYSVAPLADSNFLNRTIEGGNIYAKYLPNNNYYIANISDGGNFQLPYLNINLFTNRILGELYVNQTISPQTAYNGNGGNQYPLVLNATRQYNYLTNTYTQNFGSAQYPAYVSQEAVPTQVNGADCGSTCPPNYYYSSNPAYHMPINSLISYSSTASSQPLSLFSVFEFTTYIDNLILDMSNNTKILGYNRLVYTYIDRFGNTYYMPLDVDIANKTKITLTITPTVSPTNPNETGIAVSGVAQSVTPLNTAPLPKGSLIGIYFDQNINYYNATSSGATQTQAANYYKWAEQCAFGATTKTCTVADPLATITQSPNGPTQAQLINFYTDYNTNQQCAQEPSSLLQTPNLNECNVYGSFGLPATQFDPNTNSWKYCVPVFLNGSGTFTPQLGLVKTLRTDANGGFSATFNVCGTGAHRIMAQYYGDPAPEPNYVSQTPLSQSGGSYEFQSSGGTLPLVKTLEYGYTYAPNETTAGVNIGNYALSIGAINAIEVAIFIAAVVAILIASSGSRKNRKRTNTGRKR